MRLRTRFQSVLTARLATSLPEATATAWDHAACVVAIEQLTFKSAGGFDDDWERKTEIKGVMRAELRANRIDDLNIEPLISGLISAPVFLSYDPDCPEDTLSETARFTLLDCRDVMRDTQVVTALRFDVSGTLALRHAPAHRPDTPHANGEEL